MSIYVGESLVGEGNEVAQVVHLSSQWLQGKFSLRAKLDSNCPDS